jgi:hypothetical protein
MSENNSVTGRDGRSPMATSWPRYLTGHHSRTLLPHPLFVAPPESTGSAMASSLYLTRTGPKADSGDTVNGMRRRPVVAISVAQLVAGAAGQFLALRRGLAFNIAVFGWKGQPDRVATDSWLLGTGLSAPVTMLAAQAALIAHFAATGSQNSARALGVLGAAMAGGYLVEQEFRKAMTPARWDHAVTPVAAAGFTLAVAMARLGLRSRASH